GLPDKLGFLPKHHVHKDFSGIRDFVIELDTSRVEADKLKYIPEDNRLKIFITPFNGSFTKDDLGFSYGDYHCDVVVAVGAPSVAEMDRAVSGQKDLLNKTKVVLVKSGAQPGSGGNPNVIQWFDPQASSLSEMLMSLSEALQSGLLDNHIATALLAGIIASTNHFTATNTTPKVMTMAAQLMAAGADQATIVKQLIGSDAKPVPPAQVAPKMTTAGGDLTPSREADLPNEPISGNGPPLPPSAPANPAPVKSAAPPPIMPVSPPPPFEPARPAPPPPPISELRTPLNPPPADSTTFVPPPLPTTPPPVTPHPESTLKHGTPQLDVDSARKAVEDALGHSGPNPPSPPPPPSTSPPSVPPSPPAQ
ncbi:hypothetical protein HY346_01865, partial [Candidatus Microgenomates bacterium]|nr:hypothetical protein [Candidatus Microgenomates bacterium]